MKSSESKKSKASPPSQVATKRDEPSRQETALAPRTPFFAVQRLFEDFLNMAVPGPRVDVTKRDKDLLIQADLPGMSANDIRIRLHDNFLVLEGERSDEREHREGELWTSERSYGHFRRVVHLPEEVDSDTAEARFENGVLEITVKPIQPKARGREIEINAAKAKSSTSH